MTATAFRRAQDLELALNNSPQVKPVLIASDASEAGREATRLALEAWIARRGERRGYVVALGDEFVGRADGPAAVTARIDADPFHALRAALASARREGRDVGIDEAGAEALLELCDMFEDAGPMVAAARRSGVRVTAFELVPTTREERLADLAARDGRE